MYLHLLCLSDMRKSFVLILQLDHHYHRFLGTDFTDAKDPNHVEAQYPEYTGIDCWFVVNNI